jgi:5-dehydro-2-deoxygluconokinase
MESTEFDLVAIGDTTSDAFIRLREAEVHSEIDKANRQICMSFGAKLPYESVTIVPGVGNSANAAVSAARLGLRAALISNLGNDKNGDEAVESLHANNVDTRFVVKHDGKLTNYHYVLWYQDDRTILVKHEEYPYTLPFDFAQGKPPKWLYLSSLSEHSLPFHHEIASYLKANLEIKLAFQPGTWQIKFGAEQLAEIYRLTEIFFCNTEEAKRILQIEANDPNKNDIKTLLVGISKLGPKIVVITNATQGAYAQRNGQTLFMPTYPDQKPPLERTGAGDAFSSTLVSALVLGEPLEKALAWAPINSMSVVQQIGAQKGLLTRAELEKYLNEAPTNYKCSPL